MHKSMPTGILMASLMAGCTASPAPEDAPRPPAMAALAHSECNATSIQSHIGEAYRPALEQKLMAESGAQRVRVIRPGQGYTMDYRPERLNIHVGEDGRITKLDCG